MSDGVSVGGSLLDEDMTGVDTSMPVLAPGLCETRIKEVKAARNSANDGDVIKIQLETVKEHQSTKGETIKAGFPIFDTIPITPTEKMSKDQVKKRLAQFMEGVNGAAGVMNPLAQWAGKTVTVKLKIAKETPEYPESHKVASYVNERK